ncbi:prenyltransferase/squalene oxidase repeat-containing protein [Streptomyces curacoi]|uniref:prenyltransferase/squalene oxidase repeat-containing protein n=1 Tax=Streptomyces curacoi TaxID=146536 RepID=UPI003133CC6D
MSVGDPVAPEDLPHPPRPPALSPRTAYRRAADRLVSEQRPDGCWEGEMVWNTMILSQYVIVCAVTGNPPRQHEREAMIRHYRATVTGKGGWGPHSESSHPSLYCTVLASVALRLLGVPADDPLCRGAAEWMRTLPGGPRAVPTWGKFWLALAGLYDYRGVNPVPPEMFLLPRWVPVHPNRFYCHTRSVYQAMAYLYGARFQADLGPLGAQLRHELFGSDTLPRERRCAGTDIHRPAGPLLHAVNAMLSGYELRPAPLLRRRALNRCLRRVEHEQLVTGELGLSPVNALLNVLVLHAARPGSAAVARALAAQAYWRWTDEAEGTRYAGARSQTWDTGFAVEALLAGQAGHEPEPAVADAVRRAAAFLRGAQVTEEIPQPTVTARSPALGGWCFSEGGHRWPVSDCTAEALAALAHAARAVPGAGGLPDENLRHAVRFLLERQNRDGGFGTYERRRGGRWLEALNPSEMFSDCMVEGSYVECTASALTAFAALPAHALGPLSSAVDRSCRRAVAFLLRRQEADGSWPAAWGVNRIYGTWFAVRGLRAAGLPADHPRLRRAAGWLRAVQRADGGWGEHHRGCTENRYAEHVRSQPVSTAWSLLALLDTGGPKDPVVVRGVDWLCRAQRPDGTWEQTSVNGVFFGTGLLDYRLYARYFPLWALGRWLDAREAS